MQWNEILTAVVVALVPVAIPLVGRAYWWAATWVEAKITNERLKRVAHEAFEVTAAVGQSIAIPVKDAAADGKLSDAEVQRIKAVAMATLRQRLADLPAHLITDQRLSDAIEAAVPATKATTARADPRPAPASQ